MWIIKEEFLLNSSWEELFAKVDLIEGMKIGDLNLFDLVYYNSDDNDFVGNGIYVIKEKNEIIYIGKASSRPFIERIAGHLDLRVIGGFNNLLKKIVKGKLKTSVTDVSIAKAGRMLMEYNIILICMEGKKGNSLQFNILENVLIDRYREQSLLNKEYRLKYKYDETKSIKELVYRGI